MGFWQCLVEGYDNNPELWSNYPLFTTSITNITYNLIVIVLNKKGNFLRSIIIPKTTNKELAQEFIIPVSIESMARSSSAIRPYPLFDKKDYIFPVFDKETGVQSNTEKINAYLRQLESFSQSIFATDKIKAVYYYVSHPEIQPELSLKGKDWFVLFSVEIPGDIVADLWKDTNTFKAWSEYYSSLLKKEAKDCSVDFINGKVSSIAPFHPKKISSLFANAKLISANDNTNFTFRGRFLHPDDLPKKTQESFKTKHGLTDAVSISCESSQKAHQFLRYLVDKNGICCGEQVIVPFVNSLPPPPVRDEDLDEEEEATTADNMIKVGARTGIDYAKTVEKALYGLKLGKLWESHANASVVVLEAATSGRLSITYYRELNCREYLEQIQQWHERCKWPFFRKDNAELFLGAGAPSFDRILEAAFGWPKKLKDESYEKIKQHVRLQLIRAVFDGSSIPLDYIENAVRRVSNPIGIPLKNGKFDRDRFLSVLSTTCALLKNKYFNTKESFDMSIDLNRSDRDYLYGRLLGAADKLEEYVLYNLNKKRIVTSAIRYMQTFSMRPFTTWRTIHDALLPYIQKGKGLLAFREIESIMASFSPDGFNDDSPLSGLYLVGYYHERSYIHSRFGR